MARQKKQEGEPVKSPYAKELELDYILAIVEREECRNIGELLLFLPYGRTTFYATHTEDSNSLNTIKEAINRVKVDKKRAMRKRWETSENPTLELAAFKLMADQDELEALSMTKNVNENTHTVNIPITEWLPSGNE